MASLNTTVSQLKGSPYDLRKNGGYIATWTVALVLLAVQYLRARKRDIAVPAVGPSGRLTSYYGAFKFMINAKAMLQEGYNKYKMRTFKIPELGKWVVVVNTPELMEEVRKAPDNKLSFQQAIEDFISAEFTLGPLITQSNYHVSIVQTNLTRNIGALFGGVMEEISLGFDEQIDAHGDEWVSKQVLKTVEQIVCRASNRIFVGAPLCRDKDFIDLNIRYTFDVVKASTTMKMFPDFLKPLVGELMTSVPRSTRRAVKHLAPTIEERLRKEKEYGHEWPGKPNDMLSWLMDEAVGEQRSVKAFSQRILMLNFAAIHTSSMSFTHALLHLAAHQECVAPLREEVERVVSTEGWTKAAMQKMRKVDSFLKETQRYTGIGMLSLSRKALVDYTLSDGTFLPAGSFVICNSFGAHHNESNYESPDEFRPFRFADVREESAEESVKHQMVSTGIDYLAFGHGRHACPGRFFAANELKAMLAHLVLNYDIKLPEGQTQRPKDMEFAYSIVPNPKAHILFRRRKL